MLAFEYVGDELLAEQIRLKTGQIPRRLAFAFPSGVEAVQEAYEAVVTGTANPVVEQLGFLERVHAAAQRKCGDGAGSGLNELRFREIVLGVLHETPSPEMLLVLNDSVQQSLGGRIEAIHDRKRRHLKVERTAKAIVAEVEWLC